MADEIKPLDGKTTVDDKVVFEPQRLSYDAARVIAEKIARRISGRTRDREVVIAGSHVRVLLAGGSNRIERSLFRTWFSGDGLSATGGAVVSWAILSERGAVEDGGMFSESLSAASPKPPETPVGIP